MIDNPQNPPNEDETQTSTGNPPATPPVTPPATPPVKTYSQEELDKAIQSASSKGKNDILKALGIETIEDGKTKLTKVEELAEIEKKYTELQTAHNEVVSKQKEAEMVALLTELGIGAEGKELFLTLLSAEKGDGTLLEKGQRVKEQLIKILSPDIQFGAGKTPPKDPTLQAEFKRLQKL